MKKTILLNIPIEPLEERYSKQWDNWFRQELEETFAHVKTIYGQESSGIIKTGSFLDVFETNQYKASQLQQIINHIKQNPDFRYIIFFHDLWFPGLESLAYIRDGADVDIKITGCLHAGSYDPNDFLSRQLMGVWAEPLENSWFQIIDMIFVATKFHKKLLTDNRWVNPDKIQVTGFPLYDDFSYTTPKENIVVFPHRLDDEKQPKLFDKLADALKNTGWQFIKSKDICRNKKEYYDLLSRSKIAVSFALQETWGIAMQEAVYLGNVPVCPDRLSYSEMYRKSFLYKEPELQKAIAKVSLFIRNWTEDAESQAQWVALQKKALLERNTKAIQKMIELL